MTVGVRVIVVWWLACLIWSSTWLFIRMGLQEIPPLTFAWVRLAIALAVLAPFTLRRVAWRPLRNGDLTSIAAAGLLLLGVNYGLVFWGAQFIPSGLTAILQAMTPVLALGLGWCMRSEKVNALKVLGMIAGVAGVGTIFGAEANVAGHHALLMMGIAEVPIAVALGAVVLDERLPVATLAGAALALAGVACVLLNARRMVPCDR